MVAIGYDLDLSQARAVRFPSLRANPHATTPRCYSSTGKADESWNYEE
jgi:hypothetical protein